MSGEQFFLPPEKWCESKLNENRRYFHLFSQKTIESLNRIVFGRCYHGHSPGGRSCERALWNIDSTGNASPAGYMCFRCSGFLKHDKEYGVLLLGNQRLEAERTSGNIVHIKLNDQEIGCFEWTFRSRFFYKGSGRFYNNDRSVSGEIHLPVFFVASNFHAIGGMADNTLWGKVTVNDRKCKFLIQQAALDYYCKDTPFERNSLFAFIPKKEAEPIADEILPLGLAETDRLLLLYLFCRSIAFYEYASGIAKYEKYNEKSL